MAVLNDIEKDFIEFLSTRNGTAIEKLEETYLGLRARFGFGGDGYRELCEKVLDLHTLIYDSGDETQLIEVYKRHELLSVLRFISYSYMMDKRPAHRLEKSLKRLIKNDPYPVDLSKTKSERMADEARFLVENAGGAPFVVDYGCGLAYLSFQIAELHPSAKVCLVDIDTLNLRFAEYRFKKRNLDVQAITITKESLYPKLPEHNICIATEVIEHVKDPTALYENITASLRPGGVLMGDFSDHEPDTFHVSHRLCGIRERVDKEFAVIGKNIYKKLA